MMFESQISVVIPTYNRSRSVINAINSVLAQTREAAEIIVVDDGSSDGTEAILRDYFGNSIHLVRQENKGVSAARNAGIRIAKHELLAFLDSDDIWTPEKLERQAPLMDNPDVVLSATNWSYESSAFLAFDELGLDDSGTLRLDEPLLHLSRFEGHRLWLPTWIARRSALMRVGGFDERMRVAEDSRLLFRLAFEGAFCLSSHVGTIRSSSVDEQQLTMANDFSYRRNLTPLTLEFLYETYIRASDRPSELQRRIRKLLGYFLRNHAEHLLLQGRNRLARRRAIETLASAPRFKDALAALAVLFFPPAVHWKYRRMAKGDDS